MNSVDLDSLKPRLEALRLRPFSILPPISEVPCIETSDNARLCSHPLVSVLMATYNHADSIRQAIEGVMMQNVDFEFELIIGEDASNDCTREICFEMQQKYPECIRVLWSETNVYAQGGNSRRIHCAARGVFLAYCEGDDCWIDVNKLQRQVNFLTANPNVGICLGGTEVFHVGRALLDPFPYEGKGDYIISGRDFIKAFVTHGVLGEVVYEAQYFQTSGFLVRKSIDAEIRKHYPQFFAWNWSFNDLITLTTVASMADVALICSTVSRYRLSDTNLTSTLGASLLHDGVLYEICLRTLVLEEDFDCALDKNAKRLRRNIGRILARSNSAKQSSCAVAMRKSGDLMRLFDRCGYRRIFPLLQKASLTMPRWRRIQLLGDFVDVMDTIGKRLAEVFCG